MTTYIVLINFADRAVQNINQISRRIKNDTAAAEKVGVRVKDIHWTSGVYDAVLVADAPNDKVIKDWPTHWALSGRKRSRLSQISR